MESKFSLHTKFELKISENLVSIIFEISQSSYFHEKLLGNNEWIFQQICFHLNCDPFSLQEKLADGVQLSKVGTCNTSQVSPQLNSHSLPENEFGSPSLQVKIVIFKKNETIRL